MLLDLSSHVRHQPMVAADLLNSVGYRRGWRFTAAIKLERTGRPARDRWLGAYSHYMYRV